ncbi:MAG: 2TM domain-containing protein [Thermodesulfobacteriota bacterium]
MIIRKLRLERGWSQEQLAEISGLSVRTVQRIEGGQKPSLESRKALAAVFDIEVAQLTMEADMTDHSQVTAARPVRHGRERKTFTTHLAVYLIVIGSLVAINLIGSSRHFWAMWPALGWGGGVAVHGLRAFGLFRH